MFVHITCGVSAAAGTGHDGNFSCPGPYLMDLRLDESLTGGAGGGESSFLVGRVSLILVGAKFNPDLSCRYEYTPVLLLFSLKFGVDLEGIIFWTWGTVFAENRGFFWVR